MRSLPGTKNEVYQGGGKWRIGNTRDNKEALTEKKSRMIEFLQLRLVCDRLSTKGGDVFTTGTITALLT